MKQILSSAVFAGVAAGLIAALLQYLLLQPDIVLAERYETGELTHFAGVVDAAGHDHSTHDHSTEAPAEDGAGPSELQRQGLSVLFSLLTWCGFGLILAGAMRVAAERGARIEAAQAALWGIGGFAAFQLMPAIGLPPELPGMSAGDLAGRQVWWLATVGATAAGLGLMAYGGARLARLAGLVLLVLPHVWGAPEAESFQGNLPPELAAGFAARSLALGLVTWAALGLAIRAFWHREPQP